MRVKDGLTIKMRFSWSVSITASEMWSNTVLAWANTRSWAAWAC